MLVRQIMTSDVAVCRPDTDLAVAARLMWEHDCGFIPVVDAAGKVVGVITDRDICIASATRRLLPEQMTAAQAMKSESIHTAKPDDTVETAMAAMKRFQVRRLPVVGADGTVRGVISMNDIVLAAQQREGPAATEIVSTFAAICEHQTAGAVHAGAR